MPRKAKVASGYAIKCLIILSLIVGPVYAEGFKEELTASDILEMLLLGRIDKSLLFADKERVVEVLKKDFGATDEDLAFLMSIRAARLPYDGFDFFNNPKELLQLVSLYQEAKREWAKPVSPKFYRFFPRFCSRRAVFIGSGKSFIYWRDFYQTDHARKRFKLP